MKNWKAIGLVGIMFMVMGIVVVAYVFWAIGPVQSEWIGGQIIASLNPTFELLFSIGFTLFGIGAGQLSCVSVIYKSQRIE